MNYAEATTVSIREPIAQSRRFISGPVRLDEARTDCVVLLKLRDEMGHSLNDQLWETRQVDVSDAVAQVRTLSSYLISLLDPSHNVLDELGQRVLSSIAISHPFGFRSFGWRFSNEEASSTWEFGIPEFVRADLNSVFCAANEENFESGIESDFSRRLLLLIEKYGEPAIRAIELGILADEWNPEVVSEALRWIARINDPSTYASRLRLLEWSLFSPQSRIRDGAALGLASLDDPSTISYLERAIAREPIQELRDDLQEVLDQLHATSAEKEA